MTTIEVEFKYPASVTLTEFRAFCMKRKPLSEHSNFAKDSFYASLKYAGSFYRHRVGFNMNQLTYKCKTHEENNFIRIEHNLDLAGNMSPESIAAYCIYKGYLYNTSIFKNSFFYAYDYYTLSYYICYDENMVELGRFIEIEMKEDHPWANEKEALGELLTLEKMCRNLKVGPTKRLNESLFEMYHKE